MIYPLWSCVMIFLVLPAAAGQAEAPESYTDLYRAAEALYARESYAEAYERYAAAKLLHLSEAQSRWVRFRLGDCLWRAQPQDQEGSPVEDQVLALLLGLVLDSERDGRRDQTWAKANESLGDYHWTKHWSEDWSKARPHYQHALEWWAAAEDVDNARIRYLGLVWKVATPGAIGMSQYQQDDTYLEYVITLLENAIRITTFDHDRGRAHYLLGLTLGETKPKVDRTPQQRVAREFEASLRLGEGAEWQPEAMFAYAEWLSELDLSLRLGGNTSVKLDYARGLALFRELTTEFTAAQSTYHRQALHRIERLTETKLGLQIANIFLPDSQVEYTLYHKNLERVDFTLAHIDLTRHIEFASVRGPHGWTHAVDAAGLQQVRQWSYDAKDQGAYESTWTKLRIEDQLPAGAYILTAEAAEHRDRELVLVTDAAIVLKITSNRAVVYFCDAIDGSPIAGARVSLWEKSGEHWHHHEGLTNEEGFCVIPFTAPDERGSVFVAAAQGARQAVAQSGHAPWGDPFRSWRLYGFTDRPAYRPGETVHWKIIARTGDGEALMTPTGQVIHYELVGGPRRGAIRKGEVTFNEFGSAWGEFEVSTALPLGEYTLKFSNQERTLSAIRFRIEEYRLPQFEVRVHTPQQNGRPKTIRPGEHVDVEIEASYYFGAPVVGAEMTVQAFQRKIRQGRPRREYPWLYLHESHLDSAKSILHKRLTTDNNGRALFSFDTAPDDQNDYEYIIEARVTGPSRRQVVGRGVVQVSRQPYRVHVRTLRQLYQPQDTVQVEVRAEKPDGEPLAAKGRMEVIRDRWNEIWIDPQDREVQGTELLQAKRAHREFPPPAMPGASAWRLKFRGYAHEPILEREVRTDPKGVASFQFVPQHEGYYRIRWTSRAEDGSPVEAETTVWVADRDTLDVGYYQDGISIITDRDTYQEGDTATVMLATSTAAEYVLFGVEGKELHDYRLLHLDGAVKVLLIDITDEYKPNMFLSAHVVRGGKSYSDSTEIVVPEVERFVDLEVAFDRSSYEPQDEAVITLTTRDQDGKPIAAEVALAVVDESVFYIQKDKTVDPRWLFNRLRRYRRVRTTDTFKYKRYVRLDDRYEPEFDELARDDTDDGDLLDALVTMSGTAGGGSSSTTFDSDVQPPAMRRDFRTTAFWQPDIHTDEQGRARIKMRFPDGLTRWRATAIAATRAQEFGMAQAKSATEKPLALFLNHPRFLVVDDQATISAVVHNPTDVDQEVRIDFATKGVRAEAEMASGPASGQRLNLPAHGRRRVDWKITPAEAGVMTCRVVATSRQHADAVEKTIPIHEHGIPQYVARVGKVGAEDVTVQLPLPQNRKAESTQLVVHVTPSLALSMLDALPFLIDYPYGCIEQTMSRFIPATVVAKTLNDLGLSMDDIFARVSAQPRPFAFEQSDVRQRPPLDEVLNMSLQRVLAGQFKGWGWWPKNEPDPFMTAYVLWGLCLARQTGMEFDHQYIRLDTPATYLQQSLAGLEQPDLQAWILHALSVYHTVGNNRIHPNERAALEELHARRDELSDYGHALLTLALVRSGDVDQARVLVDELRARARIDHDRSDPVQESVGSAILRRAHWSANRKAPRWSQSDVEATAFALQALLAVDPDHELIEPAVNWLMHNRRSAAWHNTRETAVAILALNDLLRIRGSHIEDLEYELIVNGHTVSHQKLEQSELLAAQTRFIIDPRHLHDGQNEVRVRRLSGEGDLFVTAEASFFTLERPVVASGDDLTVKREYFRLTGRPTLLQGVVFERTPLRDGQALASGDRVEVVVTIEAKNDYRYLLFEDLKPAGLEAIDRHSSQGPYIERIRRQTLPPGASDPTDLIAPPAERRPVYRELRDRKIAFLVEHLPAGVWQLRYQLRAEAPGRYCALPIVGQGMYFPNLRCNSAETDLIILPRTVAQYSKN